MTRRSMHSLGGAVLVLLLVASRASAADDPAQLAEAKALAAGMAAARKAKDGAALEAHLKALPALHNALESKPAKGKLLKEAGALVNAKGLTDLGEAAVAALAQVDDAKGAYKQLKKHMPGPKDKEEVSELGLRVLLAVGALHPEGAAADLLTLGEKSKDYKAAGAAILALGNFKTAKKRVAILEDLIKLIQRFQPPTGQQVGVETEKRWKALGEPLVRACNGITGRKLRSPDDWLSMWKENKKKPKALFED